MRNEEKLRSFKYQKARNQSKFERTHEREEANGKADKSAGRMPWHQEPKKDVVNCEKLCVAVSER